MRLPRQTLTALKNEVGSSDDIVNTHTVGGPGSAVTIANRVSRERWRFAQYHERQYQERKAQSALQREETVARQAAANSARVAFLLHQLGYAGSDDLVVEVGSGAHGLIWRWPNGRRIAIDPLAAFYRQAFGFLQADGPAIVAARGEQLPVPDGSVDVVLSDNVLDHVQDPGAYLSECRRVLRDTGVLFFTIDVHHRVYGWLGILYNLLFQTGLRLVVPAFPPHPFHFSKLRIQRLLQKNRFRIVWQTTGEGTRSPAHTRGAKGAARDLFKRLFWKNRRWEMVAVPVQ